MTFSPSLKQQTSPSQPDVSQTPFGLGALGGLQGMNALGMGSANFMELQQRMQREVGHLGNILKYTTSQSFTGVWP